MTRAMDPEVSDAIWAAIEPILPTPADDHPLGCHNPRVPDRVCFRGVLIRLVTGSSWVDIEAMMGFVVSDTTKSIIASMSTHDDPVTRRIRTPRKQTRSGTLGL